TSLNIGAMYRQGNIFVNVKMLDSPKLSKLIAHELGHYVLGHEPAASVSSQAAWERGRGQRGSEGEPRAGESLGGGERRSTSEGARVVSEALQRGQRAVERGAPLTPGHLTPAEELADLRARFPEAREAR